MTGSISYLVREQFTECSTYRAALGNAEPLLAFAAVGECLDAPQRIPTGCASTEPGNETVSR